MKKDTNDVETWKPTNYKFSNTIGATLVWVLRFVPPAGAYHYNAIAARIDDDIGSELIPARKSIYVILP